MAHREAVGGVHTITLTGASHSLASSDSSSGRHARALPSLERCGSKLFVHGSFEEVTLVVKSFVGRGMDVEEALRRAGRLEPLSIALPSDDDRRFIEVPMVAGPGAGAV